MLKGSGWALGGISLTGSFCGDIFGWPVLALSCELLHELHLLFTFVKRQQRQIQHGYLLLFVQ